MGVNSKVSRRKSSKKFIPRSSLPTLPPTQNHGQQSDFGPRDQGARPHRQPGPVYPGEGGVHRGAEPLHHPQREGPRAGGGHPHAARVGARGQEAQMRRMKTGNNAAMTKSIKMPELNTS